MILSISIFINKINFFSTNITFYTCQQLYITLYWAFRAKAGCIFLILEVYEIIYCIARSMSSRHRRYTKSDCSRPTSNVMRKRRRFVVYMHEVNRSIDTRTSSRLEERTPTRTSVREGNEHTSKPTTSLYTMPYFPFRRLYKINIIGMSYNRSRRTEIACLMCAKANILRD